uniref:Uncharacterized protein n=1 Tax=Arundo donax TaxID=35708 RepID=A0A0A9GGR5_ARUDO
MFDGKFSPGAKREQAQQNSRLQPPAALHARRPKSLESRPKFRRAESRRQAVREAGEVPRWRIQTCTKFYSGVNGILVLVARE